MRKGIDSPQAWLTAVAALAILATSFGAPYVTLTALKQIAEEFGGHRSIPSAANSLAWLGTGVGGLLMGYVAEKKGVRFTALLGAVMVSTGLALSSLGEAWQLFLGHGLFIGLLGNGGINAPLYVYVSRWFDKRRGTAIALIASGQYAAGAGWPPLFEHVIAAVGWQTTMLGYSVVLLCIVIPLAIIFLKPPPEAAASSGLSGTSSSEPDGIKGLDPRFTFGMLGLASFLCCITMAMPQAHLIAHCGDLGFQPGHGAAMLSLQLVCAFFSRQFWGWMSDRIGGLLTLLICSGAQAMAITGFLVTTDEAGLFAVAAAFGLGFSGLIPAYVITARQLFPASEASWRMPALLLTGTVGMAAGSWTGGVIHDFYGFYQPAFATGLATNILNFAILLMLVTFWWRSRAATAGMDARAVAG